MNYEILFTKNFKKSFKKLSKIEQDLFYTKLKLFVDNHKHPSLRTKKIKGSSILFESSINMSIRVIWKYENEKLIIFLDIGHHDVLSKF